MMYKLFHSTDMFQPSIIFPRVRSLFNALLISRRLATHGVADSSGKTAGIARFYKRVNVKESDDKVRGAYDDEYLSKTVLLNDIATSRLQSGYHILLDNKQLKTPAKKPLILPTKSLALAIAAEWEWQIKRVDPSTMPLMSIAATAIDQPQDPNIVIDTMVQYISTDPVVCRVEPGTLADKQHTAFNPILDWVRKETGAAIEPSHSVFGAQLPTEELHKIKIYIQSLDKWHLTAAEQLAASCKSVCIALAAVKGRVDAEDVMKLARIEEDHQIEEWGLVEGGHDIDIADLRVRVFAPSVFIHLLG